MTEIDLKSSFIRTAVTEYITENRERLDHNEVLFKIMEGNLLEPLERAVSAQFSKETASEVISRVAPINVLQRLTEKLSKVYTQPPIREVANGTESDKEILDAYARVMQVDRKFSTNNSFLAIFRYALQQNYRSSKDGTPKTKVIPNHQFLVMNITNEDPIEPEIYIIFMGERSVDGDKQEIVHVYTDTQFCIIDATSGEIQTDLMRDLEQDGTIAFNQAPFTYANQSETLIMPEIQTDVLAMTLLIPILLSDLNYAVKYQSFSIIYGIDVENKKIIMAPNAFWNFQTGEGNAEAGDAKPEIGQIKPTVDIDQVLNLVGQELAMWLQSKGIKPGAVGKLTTDNFASGVSKMIDEMDSFDIRDDQQKIYQEFEDGKDRFWDLTLKRMHNTWVEEGKDVIIGAKFTESAQVVTIFAKVVPLQNRGELVKQFKEEESAGYIDDKRIIKKLNPEMGDDAMEALLDDIKKSRSVNISPDQAQDFRSLIKDVAGGFIETQLARLFSSNILKIDEEMTNPIFDELQRNLANEQSVDETTSELPELPELPGGLSKK